MSILDTSKGIALDTCVIRNMMENPNCADMVFLHIDLRGVSVHICETVALEARGQDVALDLMVAKLEGRGADVVRGDITARMRADARAMEECHEELKYPDNRILAYTKVHGLVLLTQDQDLEAVAGREGAGAINPDKLCGTDRRPRSAFENIAAAYSRHRPRGRGGVPHGTAAATHSRRPPADHGSTASRKRRRRNLHRRASPLRT